jgi:pimeloyl-ACP methyl ester carboxylesterase
MAGLPSPDAARLGCSVLDVLGVERVIVIGTSGGGLPALHFAAMFPQRVAGLVLQCAQSHRWDSSVWLPAGKGSILRFALRPTLKRLIHCAHHMQTRSLRWVKTAYLRAMSGTRFPEIRATPEALELRDAMIEQVDEQFGRILDALAGGEPQHVEGPDEVDLDDLLVRGEVVRAQVVLEFPASANHNTILA